MYYIISNPISGRKKNGYKRIEKIYNYLDENKIEYKVFESTHPLHPLEIAKEITTKNDSGNIIVIGGDGTFNEVLNGITDLNKWNVGLIPSGSGNDFAKALNLPKENLLDSLKLILNSSAQKVDYIKVNDVVCDNVIGTGIDVDVLHNFEKHKKLKGSFRYLYSLIEALIHLKWYEFDVSIDDQPFVHKKGFIATICNGSYVGGGIPICPTAKINDGKLEFVFINPVKKSRIIFYLLKLLKGKIFTFKETEHVYCNKVVIKSNQNLLVQLDGNIKEGCNEYKCEIIEKGLNMYLLDTMEE